MQRVNTMQSNGKKVFKGQLTIGLDLGDVLRGLGHDVIVAHAQKVRLMVKSRRKDDRLDARTLAR